MAKDFNILPNLVALITSRKVFISLLCKGSAETYVGISNYPRSLEMMFGNVLVCYCLHTL